ncbi:MAG TPA: glycosyl hydrolase family 18 protein [Polyangiaceae bacterium]|nr:glycosyl hydrolase family 18 protein [Polyangiaceae bacterium]
MKAAWLLALVSFSAACGGGDDGGPRSGGPTAGMGAGGTAGAAALGGTAAGGATAGSASVAGTANGGTTTTAGSGAGGGVTGGSASGGSGGSDPIGPILHPDQRTVVYLPDWRGALAAWLPKLDFSKITYLNLCFAAVDAAGNVSYKDQGLDAFVSAAHARGGKVCMAIGGASVINDGGVYATVLQDGTRDGFVNKLGQYAADHQLDCLDVDLEGNGVNQYYEAFVTALANKLHSENKEMTAAVSSWFGDKITDKAIQAFDFVNVMAYDLHNPGGSAQPVQSSSIAEATQEVDYWVGRGLAKSKAVYGVPFYGYRWNGAKSEAMTYADILRQNAAAATQDQLDLGGSTVYLNSRATIIEKAKLAKAYGGIMVWELGQDAAGEASLLKAIADATM